jgi:hypothetical protein
MLPALRPAQPPRLLVLGLLYLLGLDEALGGAVFRIHKDDVLRIAPRGVDRQEDQWSFENIWYGVDRTAFKE